MKLNTLARYLLAPLFLAQLFASDGIAGDDGDRRRAVGDVYRIGTSIPGLYEKWAFNPQDGDGQNAFSDKEKKDTLFKAAEVNLKSCRAELAGGHPKCFPLYLSNAEVALIQLEKRSDLNEQEIKELSKYRKEYKRLKLGRIPQLSSAAIDE